MVSTADGDTLTVLDAPNNQHKICLSGIDAPESGQPYGTVSRQHLGDSIFGKQVTVEYDKRDRYGRIVGKLLINGQDANLKQVEAGLAWHYKAYEHEQSPLDRQIYADAAHVVHDNADHDARQLLDTDFHKHVSPISSRERRVACMHKLFTILLSIRHVLVPSA